MMGSRGCYGSCAYCCITTLHQLAPGKRFRQRNGEGIADEMGVLYHERGTRQFVFHDDNFLVPSDSFNHARLSAFEKALKKRGIRDIALVIKCRPADANKKVLRRLKDLGLVRVFLGVEPASSEGLSDLARTQSVADSECALETCVDATLATLRSDVAFMRRFSGNPLNFCRAEIYAGTPLGKRMIALGGADL
jgi:anaerobic magnesium-protoporphyrin IX monomethyl ester cyclase